MAKKKRKKKEGFTTWINKKTVRTGFEGPLLNWD